jgi:hypothetical protein
MQATEFMKGIGLAFVAAYLFLVLSGLLDLRVWGSAHGRSYTDLLIGAPMFFLASASWFILPVGGILGLAIPYFGRKHSPKVAVCFGLTAGLLVGALSGIAASYVVAHFETFSSDGKINNAAWWASFWRNLLRQGFSLSLYAMAWTGTYAYFSARRAEGHLTIQKIF